MDRARPSQARRPMVPLAVAGTVLQPLPSDPYPPSVRPPPGPPAVSLVVALVVLAAAVAVNSPLMGQIGVDDRWAWGILGFWGEVGSVLALLGMLFRLPVVAWVGAGVFLAAALLLSGVVWVGHPLALALLAAVAAWQLRRQAGSDRQRRQGWIQV